VDLAEPAETSARRGNKKRAKSDRATHLRELLMIARVPESWIAPEHRVGGAGGADPLARAGLVDADAFGQDRGG
jgi:hypothetical protein